MRRYFSAIKRLITADKGTLYHPQGKIVNDSMPESQKLSGQNKKS